MHDESEYSTVTLAFWVLIAALALVAIFDLWAVVMGRETISQAVQRTFAHHVWWRPVVALLIGLLLWHLFLGGPL